MTTLSEGSTNESSRISPLKIAGGVALATGGLLAGYAAFRYFQSRHSYDKAREERLNTWLKDRLLELQKTLGISESQRTWLHNELEVVAELAHRACRKMGYVAPAILDRLTIEIEKQFVKVKTRVRKVLKPTEDTHIHALHDFYEEFRQKFFGVHQDEECCIRIEEREPHLT